MNYYFINRSKTIKEQIETGLRKAYNLATELNENVSILFSSYKVLEGDFSELLGIPSEELRVTKELHYKKISFQLVSERKLGSVKLNSIVLCLFLSKKTLSNLHKEFIKHAVVIYWIFEEVDCIKDKNNMTVIS